MGTWATIRPNSSFSNHLRFSGYFFFQPLNSPWSFSKSVIWNMSTSADAKAACHPTVSVSHASESATHPPRTSRVRLPVAVSWRPLSSKYAHNTPKHALLSSRDHPPILLHERL